MPVLDNPRHEIFAQEIAHGRNQQEAAKLAGYTGSSVHVTANRIAKKSLVLARIEELQLEIKDAVLVDAKKLHRRWSEMFEADIADIMTDTGSFKPITEWPKIWRQMLSAVDVKELFERSQDGGNASWDKIGEVVKLKFVGVKDLGELIGRHKAVDAFVAQGANAKEIAAEVMSEIDKRIAEGRQRAAQARIEAKNP